MYPEEYEIILPDMAAPEADHDAIFVIHNAASTNTNSSPYIILSFGAGQENLRVRIPSGTSLRVLPLATQPDRRLERFSVPNYDENSGAAVVPVKPLDFDDPVYTDGLRITPAGGVAYGQNAYAVAYNYYGEILTHLDIVREGDGSLIARKSTTNPQPDSYYYGYIVVMGSKD